MYDKGILTLHLVFFWYTGKNYFYTLLEFRFFCSLHTYLKTKYHLYITGMYVLMTDIYLTLLFVTRFSIIKKSQRKQIHHHDNLTWVYITVQHTSVIYNMLLHRHYFL